MEITAIHLKHEHGRWTRTVDVGFEFTHHHVVTISLPDLADDETSNFRDNIQTVDNDCAIALRELVRNEPGIAKGEWES
jgi:hypothetical protein